jgi:hypothetical protein
MSTFTLGKLAANCLVAFDGMVRLQAAPVTLRMGRDMVFIP